MMAELAKRLKEKLAELEQQELQAPGGVPPSEVYTQMMAIYLYQRDLCNAKYLWKRIPEGTKKADEELCKLWAIVQHLWQKNGAMVPENMVGEWSEAVAPVVAAAIESSRERAVQLIGRVYSAISVTDFCAATGISGEANAVRIAEEQGWRCDPAATVPRMIWPVKATGGGGDTVSCEEQLQRLTEFVGFLEN